jgi:colicin import membrane protein
VIPVLVGIGVALVAAIVVGLVVATRRARASSVRKPAPPIAAGAPGPDPRAVAVIRDAERALTEARRRAAAIVEEAEAKAAQIAADAEAAREEVLAEARQEAGREAAEIRQDAKLTARSILEEAEDKAREVAAAAEIERARTERALVHEHEQAAGVRRELTEMVRNLLDEVERGLETTDTNGHASGGHEESPPVRGAE